MDTKHIVFTSASAGTTDKQINIRKPSTKRIAAANWTFTQEEYECHAQLDTLARIQANDYQPADDTSKIVVRQLTQKIGGYKQQDKAKQLFDAEHFLTLRGVIDKLLDCALKCYYCQCEVSVLYDIAREMRQWTVDRIDNDVGHTADNFYIACLECNLRRRRRSDEKFLFTKQLKLVKVPNGASFV